MIKSFKHKELEKFYNTESKRGSFPLIPNGWSSCLVISISRRSRAIWMYLVGGFTHSTETLRVTGR